MHCSHRGRLTLSATVCLPVPFACRRLRNATPTTVAQTSLHDVCACWHGVPVSDSGRMSFPQLHVETVRGTLCSLFSPSLSLLTTKNMNNTLHIHSHTHAHARTHSVKLSTSFKATHGVNMHTVSTTHCANEHKKCTRTHIMMSRCVTVCERKCVRAFVACKSDTV